MRHRTSQLYMPAMQSSTAVQHKPEHGMHELASQQGVRLGQSNPAEHKALATCKAVLP